MISGNKHFRSPVLGRFSLNQENREIAAENRRLYDENSRIFDRLEGKQQDEG